MAAQSKTNVDANVRTFVLFSDEGHGGKVTKGAVRYSDGNGHQFYLRKEELATEGKTGWPEKIVLSVTLNW
jgi:hypothetical protein